MVYVANHSRSICFNHLAHVLFFGYYRLFVFVDEQNATAGTLTCHFIQQLDL